MGRGTFTRSAYAQASTTYIPSSGSATRVAEERAMRTGKLDPLVDPAAYDVVRKSLLRFEELPSGLFMLTVGTAMPIETRQDTTGSMGKNVEVALRVLPDGFDYFPAVLPGYDPQLATGIFGDAVDQFILCRPQFEMLPERLVEQLTLMVPEGGGGANGGEDPHYGIFAGAYLTDAYINRIGLKGYDFTVSDEPARYNLSRQELVRVFGETVFDKAAENGHEIDPRNLPSTEEVVQDLLKRAHAFFLQVDDRQSTSRFWTNVYGPDRVVVLPDVALLPQVQAVIIGLTEGTLELAGVSEFLTGNGVSERDAERITRSVANIPIGAQSILENYDRRPQKGDIFRAKTDLWPLDPSEIPLAEEASLTTTEGPDWL